MTIERQYGKIIFICDVESSPQCEEQMETEESDFMQALAVAKAAGWDVAAGTPTPGAAQDWIHFCPKCPRPR